MLDEAACVRVCVMNWIKNLFTASEDGFWTDLWGCMIITRAPCGWRCHGGCQLSLLCEHFSKAALRCSLYMNHSYSDMWHLA